MPSRRICRGVGGAGRDAVVLLERGGREEDLHQLAGHVAHRQLAEGAVLLGQSGGDALLQADPHRFERGERRRVVAAGLLEDLLAGAAIDQAAARPPCGRAAARAAPPFGVRWGRPSRASRSAAATATCRRMLGGTTSSTRPSRSAFGGALALAGQDHVQRRPRADEPGQAAGSRRPRE